jgi:UDP-glucose 4-epimerase
MTILITGGAGFIGSHLAAHFAPRATVRVLDNLRTGALRNLDGIPVAFLHGDILDPAALRAAVQGADFVFHFAALVSVPESVAQPEQCERLNTHGTHAVLEAAAAAGVQKVFFASSAAIYGDNPTVPKVESMAPEPRSPYAATKRRGEELCEAFHGAGRVNTVCLRFFNVFGPRQDPRGPYAAAVPIFIERARRGQPLIIFGDGTQTRDFIHVRDITAAIEHVTLTPQLTGVFNAGAGGSLSIGELAGRIIALSGSPSRIEYQPERPGDVRHSRACVDKLLATGWQPRHSLDDGLREMLAAAGAIESSAG